MLNKIQHTVLITGANRGIGLAFATQYAEEGWQVLACCREPSQATALKALTAKHPNIQMIALDVADAGAVAALAKQLAQYNIDVLINNAGVYPHNSTDINAWLEAFKINSIAPMVVSHAFAPHVARSALKKIATLSSKMGSVDDNTSGGSYSYRSSKAAVNMVMKSVAIDLKPQGISVVTLHPGWVQTDMGGSNALINTQTSVAGMRQVIANLNLDNTGRFIAFDGKEIAW